MLRKIIATGVVLTTIACADPGAVTAPIPAGSGPAAASLASCSSEQGQQLLDAGQYKQAIREFTCVIGIDPTAVEGYRRASRPSSCSAGFPTPFATTRA
jgi:hypothetical protein